MTVCDSGIRDAVLLGTRMIWWALSLPLPFAVPFPHLSAAVRPVTIMTQVSARQRHKWHHFPPALDAVESGEDRRSAGGAACSRVDRSQASGRRRELKGSCHGLSVPAASSLCIRTSSERDGSSWFSPPPLFFKVSAPLRVAQLAWSQGPPAPAPALGRRRARLGL